MLLNRSALIDFFWGLPLPCQMFLMGFACMSIGFNSLVMMISSWCLIFGEVRHCVPAVSLDGVVHMARANHWLLRFGRRCQRVGGWFVSPSARDSTLVHGLRQWLTYQDLAYRGENDGDMARTVDGLYAERKWALRFFLCGVRCVR